MLHGDSPTICRSCNMAGADLSGCDLSGCNLQGILQFLLLTWPCVTNCCLQGQTSEEPTRFAPSFTR